MPDLTLVMPYYMNPGMLWRQYQAWTGWRAKNKARLRVIIVDDGSPEPAADVPRPVGLPELEIYRVKDDRPWHQHGARNLGAKMAPDGWLLLTDMDHMLPEESAGRIFKAALDPDTVYMLDRVEADTGLPTRHPVTGAIKPHPNSFVLSRELYWRIGGYDEDLCGHYGTDSAFRARAFNIGRKGHLSASLVRYWRDIVPDASTNGLARKEGRDRGAVSAIIADKQGRPPKTLAFEWERVL